MTDYVGALSETDYTECIRLRRGLMDEGGSLMDPLLWCGALFVALAAYYLSGGLARNLASLSWLPFALLCFALWWRRRGAGQRRWHSDAGLRAECRGSVSDAGFESQVGAEAKRVAWRFFGSHVSSPRVAVLFARVGAGSLFLSRGMFASEEDWLAALGTIAAHVPAAAVPPWRRFSALLWLGGLLFVFLAWHFAQIQKPDRRPGSTPVHSPR